MIKHSIKDNLIYISISKKDFSYRIPIKKIGNVIDWRIGENGKKSIVIKDVSTWTLRLFTNKITEEKYIQQFKKLVQEHASNSNINWEDTLLAVSIQNQFNSSLNLEKYDEWNLEKHFIEDVMRFLDNVMEDFIVRAPDTMESARYSARRERSVGLGVMGFHSFLQKKGIPFDSVMAKVWNKRFFSSIKEQADRVSVKLADEKGPCPDAKDYGVRERFSNKIAIAPTASISIICGGASPGIEPIAANSFTQKTLSGSFNVRNPNLKKLLIEKGKDTESVWSSSLAPGRPMMTKSRARTANGQECIGQAVSCPCRSHRRIYFYLGSPRCYRMRLLRMNERTNEQAQA